MLMTTPRVLSVAFISQTDSEIPLNFSYSFANDLVVTKMQGQFYNGLKHLFE